LPQGRELRINRAIRVPQLRVIDDAGEQLGVIATSEAMRLAAERGLDLVEVQPQAVPPVARLMDYGRFRYEQERRARETRKSARVQETKEIRFRPKIGHGDLVTKANRAIEFLDEGHKVKLTVQFRGREITHPEIGRRLIEEFLGMVSEHGTPERAPMLEGKLLSLIILPGQRPAGKLAA
jgi:translation initiation factor IF-3